MLRLKKRVKILKMKKISIKELYKLESDPTVKIGDYKRFLHDLNSSLTLENVIEFIEPVSLIMIRWVNDILSVAPMQLTPKTRSPGTVINEHLELEYNDFSNIIRQYVFNTYDILMLNENSLPTSEFRLHEDEVDQFQEEVFKKYFNFSNQVCNWVHEKQIIYTELNYDHFWLFSFYLRLNRVLIQELTCQISLDDVVPLIFFLRNVLPNIKPDQPLALASSLTYLNEISCSFYSSQIMDGTLEVSSDHLPESHGDISLKAIFAESELWLEIGRPDFAAEALAAVVWRGFVSGGTHPVHEEILKRGMVFIDRPSFKIMAKKCPLLLLEITRRTFLSKSSQWLGIDTLEPIELLFECSLLLSGFLTDSTSMPAHKTYRSIIKTELLVRPPFDVVISQEIRNRDPGRAALKLIFHGTRPNKPEYYFTDERLLSLSNWHSARDRLNRARLEWMQAQRQRGIGMSPPDLKEKECSYKEARNIVMSIMGTNRQTQSIDSLEKYYKQCNERFVLLENQAKLFMIDLLFLGIADAGYCCVHYNPRKPEVVGAEFMEEETRGTLMDFMASAFAEDDDEVIFAKAGIIAHAFCNNLNLGSKICLIPAGDLAPLPLTAAFAKEMMEKTGDVKAIAQLSDHFFSSSRLRTVEPSPDKIDFAGFAYTEDLIGPEREFLWNELGLEGIVFNKFSRSTILKELRRKNRVVHIATHGIFDDTSPVFSGWITNDGILTGLDMLGEKFQTEFLMVNACAGSRGGVYYGSSGFGPTQIAISNGVNAVLAPTAPVDDEVATEVALAFQRALKKGLSLAESFIFMINKFISNSNEETDWRYYVLSGISIPMLFNPFLCREQSKVINLSKYFRNHGP